MVEKARREEHPP
jgi:hypothetical protein